MTKRQFWDRVVVAISVIVFLSLLYALASLN